MWNTYPEKWSTMSQIECSEDWRDRRGFTFVCNMFTGFSESVCQTGEAERGHCQCDLAIASQFSSWILWLKSEKMTACLLLHALTVRIIHICGSLRTYVHACAQVSQSQPVRKLRRGWSFQTCFLKQFVRIQFLVPRLRLFNHLETITKYARRKNKWTYFLKLQAPSTGFGTHHLK